MGLKAMEPFRTLVFQLPATAAERAVGAAGGQQRAGCGASAVGAARLAGGLRRLGISPPGRSQRRDLEISPVEAFAAAP